MFFASDLRPCSRASSRLSVVRPGDLASHRPTGLRMWHRAFHPVSIADSGQRQGIPSRARGRRSGRYAYACACGQRACCYAGQRAAASDLQLHQYLCLLSVNMLLRSVSICKFDYARM